MASCLATVALRGIFLNRRCSLLLGRTINSYWCTLPRPEGFSFPSPRFLSVGAEMTKEVSTGTTTQAKDSELFEPTEVFKDDPSTLSSGMFESVASQSAASGAFQPVDLSSLGLCTYWPQGWIQYILEVMYNYTHLPWWGCIVTLTIILRVLMLPLAVRLRVVSSKLALVSKEIPDIQKTMFENRASGDTEAEFAAHVKMMQTYKHHNVGPLSMFPIILVQAPIFLSVFHGLKGMASLPVEGWKTGGTLWFTDLSVCDPFFCLPVIACVTFLANIEVSWWVVINVIPS